MLSPVDETSANSLDPRPSAPVPHRRRPRYGGKYPRRYQDKYKELDPTRFPDIHRKVLDSGKTPAGTHRPIMVQEILSVLAPQPGDAAVDCTLGYGGHAEALLRCLGPSGRLIGLDQDPLELNRTEARLRKAGYGPEVFVTRRTNFAGLAKTLGDLQLPAVDIVLADLGVSSMQLDSPIRGFSFKHEGPLDMRMNPVKGKPASAILESIAPAKLIRLFHEAADEPFAELLGNALAGHSFPTTIELASRIKELLSRRSAEEVDASIRRVFQALRIAVNDEFSALAALLRQVPSCLRPGGRVAILSFHSGEDRRVKTAFATGFREGVYSQVSLEVTRPALEERRANPRAQSAKLRWAQKAKDPSSGDGTHLHSAV